VSRLPSALQPAWPLFKRAHRLLSLLLGVLFRRTSRLAGERALPSRATTRSSRTAELEPVTVTLHPGGKGEHLDRPQPVGEPADHWAFHSWLEYDVPDRYTLEIDGGILVGDYAASITPGGILDYETSDYFGVAGWREHPIFLRPVLPRLEEVSGSLLSLATRGTAANYYHFLLDVLPRWGIFEECLPGRVPDAVYLPTKAGYQRQLLAMLGLDRLPVVELGKHRALRAEHLLVPSTPNQTLACPTWVAQWLRENLPPSGARDLPTRLYVTRGDKPNTRRLVGEDELWPLLERRGFARLDPGTVSVQEQIDHFAAAEVIVAPHGAALSNLVFASPGVHVLELFAPNYVNPCYWAIAENIPDARYRYLVGGDPDSQPVGRPMNGVLTDVRIAIARIVDAVDDLLVRS
jgi:hypothetical protein